MDIKNFLVKKKKERSINSMDGDEKKRPRKAPSFDDSVAKAANNGEMPRSILKLDDCIGILCNCLKNLEEKINELFQFTSSTT